MSVVREAGSARRKSKAPTGAQGRPGMSTSPTPPRQRRQGGARYAARQEYARCLPRGMAPAQRSSIAESNATGRHMRRARRRLWRAPALRVCRCAAAVPQRPSRVRRSVQYENCANACYVREREVRNARLQACGSALCVVRDHRQRHPSPSVRPPTQHHPRHHHHADHETHKQLLPTVTNTHHPGRGYGVARQQRCVVYRWYAQAMEKARRQAAGGRRGSGSRRGAGGGRRGVAVARV